MVFVVTVIGKDVAVTIRQVVEHLRSRLGPEAFCHCPFGAYPERKTARALVVSHRVAVLNRPGGHRFDVVINVNGILQQDGIAGGA